MRKKNGKIYPLYRGVFHKQCNFKAIQRVFPSESLTSLSPSAGASGTSRDCSDESEIHSHRYCGSRVRALARGREGGERERE